MDLLSIDVHEMLISYQNKPINWTSVPARSPSICRPTRRKRDRVSVSVDLNRPAVVLVRPSHEGNVGSVARAMANTGLSELVLVEPAVQIGAEARAFAVGAGEILENLRRKVTLAEAASSFQRLVGTSSRRGRSVTVPTLTPRQLPAALATDPGSRTALVFGPESSGLTTDDLALCHLLVTIPAAAEQPTLNLSQAVLVLGYELFMAHSPGRRFDLPLSEQATVGEIDDFFAQLRGTLGQIGFDRDDTFPGVFRDLRRLANRAAVTTREVQILRGLCRRTEHALSGRKGPNRQ
jgi:TrmH family RNA methyltransferase